MSSCEYPSTLWDSFVNGRANYAGELSKDRVFSGGGWFRVNDVETSTKRFLLSSREKLVLVCTSSPFCKRDYAAFAIAMPSEVHTSMRRVIDRWTRVVRDPDLDVNETLQVDKESELYNIFSWKSSKRIVVEAIVILEDELLQKWQEAEKKKKKRLLDLVCSFLDIRTKICGQNEFCRMIGWQEDALLDVNVVLMLI